MLEIAGITRKTDFSPGHILNDYLIMSLTAEELNKLGANVTMYTEDELGVKEIKENLIISMVQGPEGSKKLLELSRDKQLIMNTPESIINCYRYNLIKKMEKSSIPFPLSRIITDRNKIPKEIKNIDGPLWLKRGDAHASCKEDVVKINSFREIPDGIDKFNKRGINRCAVQQHIEGFTVKFYGIQGTGFFYWYPQTNQILPAFNEDDLSYIANLAAAALDLDVYGGDAIITPDLDIIIIDMNDWPSFAPIKEKASKIIANKFIQKIKQL
ncbi:MAG TPA: hypothetical protein PK447_01145 [Ignavibacteria bacterium]|nr:hypothetical protein [Ignavibacteria bacterium]